MGDSVAKKILQSHLISGTLKPGEENSFRVDSTLVHDMSGLLAFMGFEALKKARVTVPLPLIFTDHNLISMDHSSLDNQKFLHSCAQRFGLSYSRSGNGICHSLYYHRLGKPGTLLIGADSHTATAGALGVLGIGVGGMDVSLVMSGQPFQMKTPSVLEVRLEGKLPAGTCAKDAALMLLKRLSVKGCVGKIVEYTGDGIATLSIPQRATLSNMGAEMGATSSIFPSDEQTRRFMAAQRRESDYQPLYPDNSSTDYDESITFDLSAVVPTVALPGQPDYGCPVAESGAVEFSQIFIGSCTNGSYVDLARAALIMKGRKISPNVDVLVSCSTRQIYSMLMRDGYLQMFVDAGARILECGCGPCMGIGHAPASGAVILRTSNRNYSGRSGTVDAKMYLSGTETAAASAITGCLTSAAQLMDVSLLDGIREPELYIIDDSMLVHYAQNPMTALQFGHHIRPMPVKDPLEINIRGEVSLRLGDNVSTDDIVPPIPKALTLRSNIPELSKYLFHNIDPDFAARAAKSGNSIIVAGDGYAQGSSREHAAIGCMYLGVKAVLAKSIHRIHRSNLINYGVLPLLFEDEKDYNDIGLYDVLELDNLAAQLRAGARIRIKNTTRNRILYGIANLSGIEFDVLEAGGIIPYAGKD